MKVFTFIDDSRTETLNNILREALLIIVNKNCRYSKLVLISKLCYNVIIFIIVERKISMLSILQSFLLNMPFLYFPEDKSEYIPAAISMGIFLIITVIVFRLILKVSKKQEEQTKELEEKINQERNLKHP